MDNVYVPSFCLYTVFGLTMNDLLVNRNSDFSTSSASWSISLVLSMFAYGCSILALHITIVSEVGCNSTSSLLWNEIVFSVSGVSGIVATSDAVIDPTCPPIVSVWSL